MTSAALLCNQSIALVLTGQTMERASAAAERTGSSLSQALGNTAIVLAAAVPLVHRRQRAPEAMEAPALAIPFAFFLFAAPACDWPSTGGSSKWKASARSGLQRGRGVWPVSVPALRGRRF